MHGVDNVCMHAYSLTIMVTLFIISSRNILVTVLLDSIVLVKPIPCIRSAFLNKWMQPACAYTSERSYKHA